MNILPIFPEPQESKKTGPDNSIHSKEKTPATPSLKLRISSLLTNPDEPLILLSSEQRAELFSDKRFHDALVHIMSDNSRRIGTYVVIESRNGQDIKECRANISGASSIFITPIPKDTYHNLSLKTLHKLEEEPAHQMRKQFILKAFSDQTPDEYCSIPQSLAVLCDLPLFNNENPLRTPGKLRIRFGSLLVETIAFPFQNQFGLTTALAKKLGIPQLLERIDMKIENNTLIID